MIRRVLVLVYLVVGIIVAANRGYFDDIGSLGALISGALAVLLWPLVLLGVTFRIGGGPRLRDALVAAAFIPAAVAGRLTSLRS